MTSNRWVYLTVAPDQITAEIWIDVLRGLGVNAMIRPSDSISWMGVSTMGCRLLVEESDKEEALEILEGLTNAEVDSYLEPDSTDNA